MSRLDSVTNRTLVGQGACYLIATLAPPLASLLVTPLITGVLDAPEYGRVASAMVAVQLLGMVLALGVPALITREAVISGGGGVEAARMLLVSIAFFTTATLALGLTAVALAGSGSQSTLLIGGTISAGCGLAAFNAAQAFMRGTDRVGAFVAGAFALSLLGPACGLALTLTWTPAASVYLTGFAAGYLAVGAGAVALLRPGRKLVPRFRLRAYLGESLPMLPHQASMYGATGLLVISAGVLTALGSVGSGAMQIALLAGTPPLLVLTALNNAWAPQMYKVEAPARAQAVSESAAVVAWFTAGIAAFSAWLAPLVVAFLAPPWASENGAPVAAAVVSTAALAGVVYLGNVHLLFGAGKARTLWLTSPLSLVIALVATAPLFLAAQSVVPVSTGLPAFYLLQAVLTGALVRKKLGALWGLRPLALPSALGVTTCLAAAVLATSPEWWPVRVLVGGLTGLAFAFVALRQLRG